MFNIRCKKRGTVGTGPAQSNINKTVPTKRDTKQRSYRFTLNNYKENDAAHLEQAFMIIGAKKFVFQEEIGKKTKTPHLQGCVFFKNAIAFSTMKKINNRIAWYDLDYPKKAIAYCLKSDTRKPLGGRWYYGIDPIDYEDKPLIPKMNYYDWLAWMRKKMAEECEAQMTEDAKRFNDIRTGLIPPQEK